MFAKNVINGDYKEGTAEDVFVQLVEAMVTQSDKKKRGVGLQGFRYAPGLKELSHLIHTHSHRAYQAIRNILPLPTARSLQ